MRSLLFLIIAVVLMTVTVEINAQATRTISSISRRLDEFSKQNDKAAHDEMSREMNGRKPSKEALQNAARINAETKEDLETLQSEYNAIAMKLNAGATIDDAFLKDTAGKIQKHASRLNSNLVFPKLEENDHPAPAMAGEATSRVQAKQLCSKIFEFLSSPMIENPNVIDVKTVKAAKQSLESIIELSSRLREPSN